MRPYSLGVWEARELLWGHREISIGTKEQMLLKQETGSQRSRKWGSSSSQAAPPWDYNSDSEYVGASSEVQSNQRADREGLRG